MTNHVLFYTVDAVASIAIDLGGEWIKTGLVMPGVPMEIVLNQ